MDNSELYQPIACGTYDELEVAILRRSRLRLRWREAAGGAREGVVEPLDLFVREGVEYLRFRFAEEESALRLDWIERFEAVGTL